MSGIGMSRQQSAPATCRIIGKVGWPLDVRLLPLRKIL